MAFLGSINFSIKTPSSSDITLFDGENVFAVSSDKTTSICQEQNLIVIFRGELWNKAILTTLLHLPVDTNVAKLLLKGFQNKGTELFDQLDGSFALCIINISEKTVIGLRDHFGLQNLYYYHQSDSFLISDDIQEILKITSPEINEKAIKDYFDFEENNKPYNSETFFANIHKILPAYFVSFQGTKIEQLPYWQPTKQPYKNLSANEQLSIFREKLFNAIEKRASPNENICTNLSGGLDSSSVSCIAKVLGHNPNAIYFSSGHTSTDESYFAQQVANQHDLALHDVGPIPDPLWSIKEFIRLHKMPDMLFMPVSSFFSIRDKVENLKSTKILTGDGGDSVIGYGNEYLHELYESKKWSLLNNAIRQYVQNRDLSFYFKNWLSTDNEARLKAYATFFHGQYIKTYLKKRQYKKAFGAYYAANRYFKISHKALLKKGLRIFWKREKKTTLKSSELLTKRLISNTNNTQSNYFDVNRLTSNLLPFQKQHLAYSFTKLNLAVVEQQNAIMRSRGIEAMHPFLDKDLIEISLAISSEIRFDNGLGRGTLRKALEGILPETVRTRTSKVEFSEYLLSYFENLWANAEAEIDPNHKVWTFVEKAVFDQLILHIFDSSISYKQKTKYVWLANRTINLALWLDFVDTLSEQQPNYNHP